MTQSPSQVVDSKYGDFSKTSGIERGSSAGAMIYALRLGGLRDQ